MYWALIIAIITIPLAVVAAEAFTSIRTRSRKHHFDSEPCTDFRILVPIWGNVSYLENVEYLSPYGSQVTLCTTGDESDTFNSDIARIAATHHFKIFFDTPLNKGKNKTDSNERSTSGTIRDRVIRNALNTVQEEYVVPLDADSTSVENLSKLVGELRDQDVDIASIRIVPRNNDSFLAQMQVYEYNLAMRLRFLAPWLVSGACHPARTAVLQDVMSRHSLFFQGNDVETGLIANSLGYKVGHIPFVILTTVPDKFRPWFRQRLAWAGGEFRLFLVNFKFIMRHPFFWFYGAIITIILIPARWLTLLNFEQTLFMMFCLYTIILLFAHQRQANVYIIFLPLYTLFNSLVMVPLGIYWYFHMARKDKNAGVININREYESL